MARAGRQPYKHVAPGRQEPATIPHHPTARHKAGRGRTVVKVAGPALLALSLVGTIAAYEVADGPVGQVASARVAAAPLDLSLRTAQISRNLSRAASRTAPRPLATAREVVLEPAAVGHLFATAPLNLRTAPSPRSQRVRTAPFATRLAVTGQRADGWAEVLVRREVPAQGRGENRTPAHTVTAVRWVNAAYLAKRKPSPPEPEPEPEETTTSSDATSDTTTGSTTGVSGAACPDGSSIESGLTSGAVGLYRAVCAAFPALASYGGYDPHGEHVDGRAIDFMVTDSSLGQAVADYVLANAGTLGVRDIIWAQHIWTPEQASSGWRAMEDRGSPTANHYDHVHVAVF